MHSLQMNQSEPLNNIKKRHSNFHHFAKTLKESVEIFGTRYVDTPNDILKFYHGINAEVIFRCTTSRIFTVMSTTLKINVAWILAQNNGLIVEMIPSPTLRYFDVRWLSMYPCQEEFLFVGGQSQMNFVNIIHTSHFICFKKYIDGLRIIDTMFKGEYFTQMNDDIVHSLELNLEKLKVNTDISSRIKRITCDLIDHEANKYKPNQYKMHKNLHTYIDKLLHNICLAKKSICVDIETLNSGLLKKEIDLNGNI